MGNRAGERQDSVAWGMGVGGWKVMGEKTVEGRNNVRTDHHERTRMQLLLLVAAHEMLRVAAASGQ